MQNAMSEADMRGVCTQYQNHVASSGQLQHDISSEALRVGNWACGRVQLQCHYTAAFGKKQGQHNSLTFEVMGARC